MKKYNTHTKKIETLPKLILVGNIQKLSSKMTSEQLCESGYLEVVYGEKPDKRYYDFIESVVAVDCEYHVTYNSTAKPLAEVKARLKSDVSSKYKKDSKRPRVDTSLGYFIDGSRDDLDNFERGLKRGSTKIMDADNMLHDATREDFDTCVRAIEDAGEAMIIAKWKEKLKIDSFSSIQECIDYEKNREY